MVQEVETPLKECLNVIEVDYSLDMVHSINISNGLSKKLQCGL